MSLNYDPFPGLERAEMAAIRVGHAGAMIANLVASRRLDKVGIWLEEQRVWQDRVDKLGSGHLDELAQLSANSFQANYIDKIH